VRFAAVDMSTFGTVRLAFDDGRSAEVGTGLESVKALRAFTEGIRREHVRCWTRDPDSAFRRLVAEGHIPAPGELRAGDSGVGAVDLGPRLRMVSIDSLLPGPLVDQLDIDGPPERVLDYCTRAQRAVCDALGEEPGTSLARMALDGVRAWGRPWAYPEPEGGPMTDAARACLHGGYAEVWQGDELLAEEGQVTPEYLGAPGAVLPEGWTLVDEDRSSAYAAEASRPLPSVWGPAVNDAGAAGGALVEANVDLEGFTGVAIPVRVKVGRGVRQFPADRGAWRGWWTSPVLEYAASRGARVTVHKAIGWKDARPYLEPGMAQLFRSKMNHARGTVERATLTAAMQRAVGSLARRTPTDRWMDARRLESMDVVELDAEGVEVDLGRFGGLALVRCKEGLETPRGTCPVWTAFVVGWAWVEMCRRVEDARKVGGRPLYADTDGLLWARPPGVEGLEYGERAGDWQVRDAPGWSWVERSKMYLRGRGENVTGFASAGIPRARMLEYLRGNEAPTRAESVREQAGRRSGEPAEVKMWAERKAR